MLAFPYIDPIAFSLGPLKIRWYGLMYLLAFLCAWLLANWRAKKLALPWSSEQIGDLIFYGALGVIVGGRLGYMLFYSPKMFFHAPWTVFKTWEGGMSFHGGLLGVLIALWLFARRMQKSYLEVTDFVAPLIPLGLGFGRLGNFINGELWGRITTAPWGMIFPTADDLPRHPSQLYELFGEGLCLFLLLWFYALKPRPLGRTSGLFLMGYALVRVIAECFRQPDFGIGFIAFHWLTMGQLLSIPMFFLGVYLWSSASHRQAAMEK